jgi:acetyl-CoA carboxylase carboxyl transferase subunit beta
MPARARLHLIADPESLGALIETPVGGDPLRFVDTKAYPVRLAEARAASGEDEAFIAAPCTIGGVPSMLGAFDFAFMGGSMSPAVGERITRVFEQAAAEGRAVVLCTASGGARMQEGTLSLFQMTKTVMALEQFRRAKKPYVAVLCHPTMGGVAASFGTLADVLIAEPQARIGFAGPRVIEQLLGRPLPDGFQRAEFLFQRGFIDRIVPRPQLRAELVRLVPLLAGAPAFSGTASVPAAADGATSPDTDPRPGP